MLELICAAVIMYAGPETDHIPPLVHGKLAGEKVVNGKGYFIVRYKDLLGRKQINYFESNTCKFKFKEDQ